MQTDQINTQPPQQHPVIQALLTKRGFSPQQMQDFFSWNLNDLPNFSELLDINKAATRLIEAMNKKQKIGIYGDYDVDGTTSCALLYHFFKSFNIEVELYQPSRFIEGYGLHLCSIDSALNDHVEVLVTVDCGISNIEAAQYAKEKHIDLIITDHHRDAGPTMPNAYAVINPNRRDEPLDSPMKSLAGVGVAFALCWEIKKILESKAIKTPSLYPLLPFVACGTICDLAVMNTVNLKLTRHGLKAMTKSPYPLFQAYLTAEEKRLSFIPSEKMSFHLGPMINSKGRLDHPELALKALISDNIEQAREILSQLKNTNTQRKFVQNDVYKSARDKVIDQINSQELLCSMVYDPQWHEGVIGIVASKLVENFKVPALVFTDSEQEGIIKASVRSAGDLNIFELLDNNRDLFIKFGGHKAAAGLSMKKENYHTLQQRLNQQLSELSELERRSFESYDLELRYQDITPQLVKTLDALEPFGMGNKKPIFRLKGVKIESYKILKDQHVRWTFKAQEAQNYLQGISFNYLSKWSTTSPEELYQNQATEELSIFFTLGINRFNGKEYLQLIVDNIKFEGSL